MLARPLYSQFLRMQPIRIDWRILLQLTSWVEDERFAREVAAESLPSAGYGVLKAGPAREAVKTFHRVQETIDLLDSDVPQQPFAVCLSRIAVSDLAGELPTH